MLMQNLGGQTKSIMVSSEVAYLSQLSAENTHRLSRILKHTVTHL